MSYTSLVGSFVYKDPVFASKLDTLAENDDFLKDNGWATSTKTAFFQASAPTGWTKDITAALDGKILRVVSGAGGGTGGSFDIAGTITLQHANAISSQATHTHTYQHSHPQEVTQVTDATFVKADDAVLDGTYFQSANPSGGNSLDYARSGTNISGGTSFSDGSHDHGASLSTDLSNIALKYMDIIICAKDTSSGYTDITDTFIHNKKIDFDEFDEDLADNDKYNYDRLTSFGSIAIFGQQNAPTGWTKLTTQNDAALRVETGTGGGTGGSAGFSQIITLQHNHTTTSDGTHTHSGSHTHSQNFHTLIAGTVSGLYFQIDGSNHLERFDGTAVTTPRLRQTTSSSAFNLQSGGTHTHTIGNALADVTLAYFDVIQCSKDSTGSSSVYTDLTAEFAYKKLVSKQRLNKLAANDDYVNYHTIPSASVSFFYQASAP